MIGVFAMPKVYLSPSVQEYNPFYGGGNEEYYMNLIADAMEPYLRASGIEFSRNRPDMTLSQVINDSNSSNNDLHLAIHSNAAPDNLSGQLSGADIYYYPTSTNARRFANIIRDNYSGTYYNPNDITIRSSTSLGELRRTTAPAVLVEVAYHDNPQESQWIRDNINEIARSLSQSVADYFGVPLVIPAE